jgi:hypothetical protein
MIRDVHYYYILYIWRSKGGSGSILNDVNNDDYVNNSVQISNTKVNSTMSNDTSKDNYKIIQPFLSLLTKYFNSRTLVYLIFQFKNFSLFYP